MGNRMHTDRTFITNDAESTVLDRFNVLIKDAKFFDCLIGYFYHSGFHLLYPSLENTKKIRILVGISTDTRTYSLVKQALSEQQTLSNFSTTEVKERATEQIIEESNNSPDKKEVETGMRKFIDWIKEGKLEVRAYPSARLHAKIYIMSFEENKMDVGRVITGSSNFTEAGLIDNLEFNVELKNASDYYFAKEKFEALWKDSVDISEKYVEVIETRTWLNENLTPYELYLKFLYEYFKEKINIDKDEIQNLLPTGYKELEYQKEAVKDAKSKLEAYGGVFISDVVGLGKTYISAMLIKEIGGRTLVLAPPSLINRNNPGSWPNVFFNFQIPAYRCESIGMLNKLQKTGVEQYDNIIIDESHRFRTETNQTYDLLHKVCQGKKIILVSATPYNNSPGDILSQIKLFQRARNSSIPNVRDLQIFFDSQEKKLKGLDRQKDQKKYLEITKQIAKEIRDKVLKYIMVRRTRSEIEKYFAHDLKKQKLKFPTVSDPEAIYYEFSEEEDKIFTETVRIIAKEFSYSRYKPMIYHRDGLHPLERTAQENMGKFMKILLVKRLESSFFAFRKTIERFIYTYKKFIEQYNRGTIYISKSYSNKIFELLEDENFDDIEKLVEEEKAEKFKSDEFNKTFIQDLEKDLESLNKIHEMWKKITRDPKLDQLNKITSTKSLLKNNKWILFTESKETAEYLGENLTANKKKALVFSGSSSEELREAVIQNFDANSRTKSNEYQILITTEVLAEGVNLHRSNIVINYDIPWNPTRLMQRAGRINRVDTKFNEIHVLNFFPTSQSNDEIKLKEAAESKITAFIEMLGSDAKLLTNGEVIQSHDLFNRLSARETITGETQEEESELKYLSIIRDIRDKNIALFEKIKKLPKKARSSKKSPPDKHLITYFRKGKLHKFYLAGSHAKEIDFIQAAELLTSKPTEPRKKVDDNFYELLEKNKTAFAEATQENSLDLLVGGNRGNPAQVLKHLKAIKNAPELTDDDQEFIQKTIELVKERGLSDHIIRKLKKELSQHENPIKILGVLQKNIPQNYFEPSKTGANIQGPREVILSLYFAGE